MSKEEEILSAEFWVVENYNMEESDVISFEMMNAYAEYLHQSRVNAISDENKNLQDAFDKMYDNCLRLLKKYEPKTLEKRIKEIENV